jgi:phage-related protein
MWAYEFYSDDDGYEPVKEFICSLDEKKSQKISNNDIRIARERMKNDLNKRGGR